MKNILVLITISVLICVAVLCLTGNHIFYKDNQTGSYKTYHHLYTVTQDKLKIADDTSYQCFNGMKYVVGRAEEIVKDKTGKITAHHTDIKFIYPIQRIYGNPWFGKIVYSDSRYEPKDGKGTAYIAQIENIPCWNRN